MQDLLNQAPPNPWLRLDFLRASLNKVVVAAGAGVPGPVPPARVQDLLTGNHEGTPYEIVAAEALLARWAGVPSRIGFGFDVGQTENNVVTIRPKNAAQFLEVWFAGYGWVPVIGAPPKAKVTLNTDKNVKVDPTITASDDVAVEVYVPIELKNLRQLYQTVRDIALNVLPFVVIAFLAYLWLPWVQRARRGAKRRRWGAALGPVGTVAVEYAEFRDLATDLGVGDPLDTPLEYLNRLVEDHEHTQLAWLVTRVVYGDLGTGSGPIEIEAARELGESLRRRMFRAQPFQTRVLALVSRASLIDPYTREIPNIELLKLRRAKAPVVARRAGGRRPPARGRFARVRRLAMAGRN